MSAKLYCKRFNLKFEGLTNSGFIASQVVPIFAGMEFNTPNYKIKKVGKKRIFTDFIVIGDDVIDNGKIKTEFIV